MARVAFVVGDGYEDSEFRTPYENLTEAGHELVVIGKEKGVVVSGKRGDDEVTIEATPDMVEPGEFDAVVIPGGWSPDRLRTDAGIVDLVRRISRDGRPVAAICHAGSLLIEADVVDGRTVTSYPSIRTDLRNAGAIWVDDEVVVDDNLITSRRPDDLPAFTEALLARL